MKLFLSAIVLFSASFAQSSPIEELHKILKKVAERSSEFRVLELERKVSLNSNETVLADFDSTASFDFSLTDSKDPQTSPFSSDSTQSYEYSLSASKLWSSGFSTTLEYSLTDSLTTFASRSDSDFIYPTLGLTLETEFFADLVGGKQLSRLREQKLEEKSISIEAKMKMKTVLVESLLSLADTLETQNNLKLQKDLCLETKAQNRVLQGKWKRRSISERDYLLGTKDLNSCLITEKKLAFDVKKKGEDLRVRYRLSEEDYDNLDVDFFFKSIVEMYKSEDLSPKMVKIDDFDDLTSLRFQIDVLQENEKQLKADLRPDLSLALTGGLQGLNQNLGDAHSDLSEGNFPYILATASLSFPFENRTAQIAYKNNKLSQETLKARFEQKKIELSSRLSLLAESISSDLLNYERLQENETLSEKALREAERDFRNGRINFQSLSEFNKGLIQSRQQLSQERAQIVVQLTEYFDYFKFFERYFAGSTE